MLVRCGEAVSVGVSESRSVSLEAVEGMRRTMGSQHPETLVKVGNLGQTLCNMGNLAAATPLLEEAVEGLSALADAGHHVQLLERSSSKPTTFQPAWSLVDGLRDRAG